MKNHVKTSKFPTEVEEESLGPSSIMFGVRLFNIHAAHMFMFAVAFVGYGKLLIAYLMAINQLINRNSLKTKNSALANGFWAWVYWSSFWCRCGTS